jgi:hypothetical protein
VTPRPDPGERERILARATRYPYEAPQTSFLLGDRGRWELIGMRPGASVAEALFHARARDAETGEERGLRELDPAGAAERTAVLAFGSNRTAEALDRKRLLPGFPAETPIVVLRASLHGLDVVYSAHLSPYGSVGAALQRSPGTSAEVCVTLLTDPQLAALDETEPNYTLAELRDVDLELEGGSRLDRVQTYVSRHGCLVLDGSEVALAAIPPTTGGCPHSPRTRSSARSRRGSATAATSTTSSSRTSPTPSSPRTARASCAATRGRWTGRSPAAASPEAHRPSGTIPACDCGPCGGRSPSPRTTPMRSSTPPRSSCARSWTGTS